MQHGQTGKNRKTRCKCTGIFSLSEGITIILFKIFSKLSVMNIYYFIQLEKGKQILFRNLDRYTSSKNLPANAGDIRDVGSVSGQEDPLEEEMTAHSSLLV